MVRNQPVKQTGTGGSSAAAKTSTGSGARPKGGKYPTPSSNPASAQRLRGK